LYLGIVVTSLLGHLVLRAQLFDPNHAVTTMANLVQHEGTARLAIALELGIVLTQVLTGLWFFRLFRSVDGFAAGSLAAFSCANAVVVLGSAACLGTALHTALDKSLASPPSVQLMYVISDQLWIVGDLFFGLWLIPMGLLVLRSRWMPIALGWLLVVGGVGYVIAPFVTYLFDATGFGDALALPASVAELWMVGFLLFRGVRPGPTTSTPSSPTATKSAAPA
jgi:hypothetical protein